MASKNETDFFEYRDFTKLLRAISVDNRLYILSQILKDRILIYCISSVNDFSLLKYAISLSKTEIFDIILELMDHDTIIPYYSFPSLTHAVIHGSLYMISRIIDKFGNINVVDPQHGITALHATITHKNNDYIKKAELLLKRGADKNIKDKKGKTVTDYAIQLDEKEMVILLSKYQ